jgi:hypothetical protein
MSRHRAASQEDPENQKGDIRISARDTDEKEVSKVRGVRIHARQGAAD